MLRERFKFILEGWEVMGIFGIVLLGIFWLGMDVFLIIFNDDEDKVCGCYIDIYKIFF